MTPSFASLLEGVRFVVAAALVLWLPGYAFTAALFGQKDLRGVERILITLGSSISLVILVGLGLHLVGVPLTGTSWGIGLGVVTLAAGAIAWSRPTHRPALPRPAALLALRKRDSLLFGLAALLVIGGLGLSRIGAEEQPQTGFTELSMTSINDDSVRLAVHNQESDTLTYRVVFQRDGNPIAEWPALQLGRGQGWEMEVQLPVSERKGVELILYRADAPGEIYRKVALGPAPTSGT